MPLPLRRCLLALTTAFAGSLPGWATAIVLFGVVSPAFAQQRTIKAFNGVEDAIVWKDGDAMSKGFSLIRGGVHRTNPSLLVPLIACFVHVGDHIVITDFGFGSSTIMVVDGKSTGCQGDLQTEFIVTADQ